MTVSLLGKRWIMGHTRDFESPDELCTALATARNLTDILSGKHPKLSDPWIFSEMKKATERVLCAISGAEKIAIIGDYDADGVTATALLLRFFRRHYVEPIIILPHRVRDGYGIKTAFIDAAKEQNVSLIVTVDTGITAHAEIRYAKDLGIDTIVTDHHYPRGGAVPACAVLHPTVPAAFPNGALCGAGVAFTFVRALEEAVSNRKIWPGIDEDMLLATIGTIADAMPLTGENRALVHHGLKIAPRLGAGSLKSFIEIALPDGARLRSSDIAFRVAPLINACGRMDDPMIALDALTNATPELLHQVVALNDERKALTTEHVERAKKIMDPNDRFICVKDESFLPGLVGLIAGRLTEEFGKPTLVATGSEGKFTASLRSIPEMSVVSALETAADMLTSFGGHSQAAGCSFTEASFKALKEKLNGYVDALQLPGEALLPRMEIDAVIPHTFLTLEFLAMLEKLEPFGVANREPQFILTNQRISNVRRIGAEANHLTCAVGAVRAVGFNLGPLCDILDERKRYDIAARAVLNNWNDKVSVQLQIRDIRLNDFYTGTSVPSTVKTSVTLT